MTEAIQGGQGNECRSITWPKLYMAQVLVIAYNWVQAAITDITETLSKRRWQLFIVTYGVWLYCAWRYKNIWLYQMSPSSM